MRWGFLILSALLVTKASASCNREDCETGLSVGVGVASVCATVGSALCVATGWATMGLSCAVGLGCGVTAGVAEASKEACRACGHDGGGAGLNADKLSSQMTELGLTAKQILDQTLELEGQIQLAQIIALYGPDITNYKKTRGAFDRLSKNASGLILRNLDQESFEKAANSANHGLAVTAKQIFEMMTGGHPLKAESIFQAVPESCQNGTKNYFIRVMMDCYLLESVARAMRGESMSPTRVPEFKKQLILVEDQFIKDCGCPEPLVKTTRHPGLHSALESLASSLPLGHCTSQVTYSDQPIPSFIADDRTDRLTLKKIDLIYSVAPFSPAKSASAKATAEKYRMEEVMLAQYLFNSDSSGDLPLYENSLFCAKSKTDSCPGGYTIASGDVQGWGSISGNHQDKSMIGCQEMCDNTRSCCSFEWSPTTRVCNLNNECRPTRGQFKDYLFCMKAYVTIRNVPCSNACDRYGEDYWWCRTKKDSWDYCSAPAHQIRRGG